MVVRAEGGTPAPATPPRQSLAAGQDYMGAVDRTLATQQTGTGAPPPAYNSDTRPVAIDRLPNVSHISMTPDTMADRGYDANNYSANIMSVYDAKGLLSYWRSQRPQGDTRYDEIVSIMRATGYLGARANSLTSIEDAWTAVLEDGASLFNANKPGQSDVMEYLYGLLRENGDQSGGDGSGSGSGSGSGFTSTVDLTDPGTATALVDNALSQYLGRRASDKETQQFRAALRAMEMANPQTATVETVKTKGKDGKPSTSTSAVVRGGDFNPQVFADEWAASQDGAGEYQAVTTFLDAFMGSLGNQAEVVK